MKSISILSLLLHLSLFLTLTAAAEPDKLTTNHVNLIPIACENSTNAPLCFSVLNADPASKTSDLKGLAFMALKTAANAAANTSTHVRSLLDRGSVEGQEVEDNLRGCAESYLDVVDQIDDSVDALVSGNFKNVDIWVTVAVAYVVTCDGSLKGKSAPSAKKLLEKNVVVKELCINALEVVHNLAKSN